MAENNASANTTHSESMAGAVAAADRPTTLSNFEVEGRAPIVEAEVQYVLERARLGTSREEVIARLRENGDFITVAEEFSGRRRRKQRQQ